MIVSVTKADYMDVDNEDGSVLVIDESVVMTPFDGLPSLNTLKSRKKEPPLKLSGVIGSSR